MERANEFKTRGNDCIKDGQYQKVVHYYTEAVRLNKSEVFYYTNRALWSSKNLQNALMIA